jgi:hypothetical protein
MLRERNNMGTRKSNETKSRKLDLRKETLRHLRTIGDADLGQVIGGKWGEPPPVLRPSLSGC